MYHNHLLKYVPFLMALFVGCRTTPTQEYVLHSPNSKLEAYIIIQENIRIDLRYNKEKICSVEDISMLFDFGSLPANKTEVALVGKKSVNEVIIPEINEKFKSIEDQYETVKMDLGGYGFIEFRAYDNGLAYRFVTQAPDSMIVQSEQMNLHCPTGDSATMQFSERFRSSYETPYEKWAINEVPREKRIHLPFLIQKSNGFSLVILESDLEDYPGLWFQHKGKGTLSAILPGVPRSYSVEGRPYGHGQVLEYESYIARTTGERTFPWRIFAVASNDGELLKNTLVYQLAKPSQIDDISWIEPGVVTFDWWGRRNIYGVNFKSGINTETAKYFIDFAADFGFEYFLFDDGWTSNLNLFDIRPELDMEEVMEYAREKDVKILLWVIWATLERQMEEALDLFEKWGIAGLKIDFMNRDDQEMVRFYHRIAAEAASRNMVIDFHGAYKPAGLRRKFPNVLTREGLIEFEYNGWTDHANPVHHNLLPYIRMLAGPMDYIPATMNNATKNNFRPVGDHPMGLGTRAHAIALWIILESPMVMLPDAPSDYYRERECTEFISKLPVVWDDLYVLHAQMGEFTALARKHGEEWYVGAITNWTERDMEIDFSFLEAGEYRIEWIEDGMNANTRAIDYQLRQGAVSNEDVWTIHLASGGGWVARIYK